jgi:hypothetical protein
MRFQVPQFIEVEDKIFGPLTLKQFLYLAGGAGLSVILYMFLPPLIAIIIIFPVASFACALAFLKINNRPFIHMLESAFTFVVNPKLYIWKQEERPVTPTKKEKPASTTSSAYIPKLSNSKLKEMTWTLDTKGKDMIE